MFLEFNCVCMCVCLYVDTTGKYPYIINDDLCMLHILLTSITMQKNNRSKKICFYRAEGTQTPDPFASLMTETSAAPDCRT